MHGEAPEFKRCCFCIPLRRGLIGWGYTKLVLHILVLIYVAFVIYWFEPEPGWRSLDAQTIAILTCINICFLVDMSVNIVFIVAGHKKSDKLLRISYVYNIVWLGIQIGTYCFVLYRNFENMYRLWSYVNGHTYISFKFLVSSGFAFSLIFVQIYLILLIRSEITKLRHQRIKIQFTNHAATGEPQCTLHRASDAEQCTDKKHVVQDCCTDKNPAVQECCTDKKPAVQELHGE